MPAAPHFVHAVAAAALALLAGCAHRASHRLGQAQPRSDEPWTAIFPTQAFAQEADEDLAARRNGLLNERPEPGPLTAADEWPDPARPSMEADFRIHIPSNERTFLFFGYEPRWPWHCR